MAGAGALAFFAWGPLRASSPRVLPSAPLGLAAGFEANVGQAEAGTRFAGHGGDLALLLGQHEARLQVPGCRGDCDAFRLRWLNGGGSARLYGEDPLPRQAHYRVALGTRALAAPTFAVVVYRNIYPGVDLRFSGYQGAMQYAFFVDRGASADSIRLEVDGARRLAIDSDGNLRAEGARGRLSQEPPAAYQIGADGEAEPVDVRYVVRGPREIGFSVGTYDVRRSLVVRAGRGVLAAS
jgi:hypothetical protein